MRALSRVSRAGLRMCRGSLRRGAALSAVMGPSPRASIATSCAVREEDSHDDFKPKIKVDIDNPESVKAAIESDVKGNKVMLYMKGTPVQPMCGFSYQAVRILHHYGVEFNSFNVLESPAFRQGIKAYSDWPTIPQLYVGGEFVGGCDILTQMHQEGELKQVFEDAGIAVSVPEAETRQ